MSIVKIQHKGQMIIPTSVRTAVGMVDGDLVDVKIVGRKTVITPTLVIDRSKFPNTDDQYTPAQRRIIDREIAKGLVDVKAGRVHGPFNSAEEMTSSIEADIKKLRG